MKQPSLQTSHDLDQATKHWKYVAPILTYPKNEFQYKTLTKRLDQLLDIVGENEKNSLIGLIDILSNLIELYDSKHFAIPKSNGLDALKHLIEVNNLSQSDLPELGSQGVVSEILQGKRNLNLRQIKALAKRFNVNAATFIDD